MDTELEAIRDAMSLETRDEAAARALADTYVDQHPGDFTFLQPMTIEQLVASVDVFRDGAMEREQWLVETWLLHRFAPQTIGGTYQAQLRIPGQEN